MADIVDIANDLRESEIASRLKAIPAPVKAQGCGTCFYCAEPLRDTHRRWCDSDCRNDWERQRNKVGPVDGE